MSEHLSDLALDALRLGQAPEGAAGHLQGCPRCQARSAELERDALLFRQRFQVEGLAAEALAAASKAPPIPWWRRALWPSTGAAAAATLLIALVTAQDNLRTKGGGSEVELFVLSGQTKTLLAGAVDPQAHLALSVRAEGPRQVRVLWSEQPGQWTALAPEAEAPAWQVRGPSWLEREIVLDGAPEPETLGYVVCEATVDHAAAVRMLSEAPRADCQVGTIRILKR